MLLGIPAFATDAAKIYFTKSFPNSMPAYASIEVAKELIATGADVAHKNKQGKTAEMLAAENGHQGTAELLRESVKKR